MRALLDTHALLWWLEDSPALGPQARIAIAHPDTDLAFSMASVWEIAIKQSLGKLRLRTSLEAILSEGLTRNGIRLLPVEPAHCLRVRDLPYHHRDPFDRMLAAQCLTETLVLLSADAQLDAYGVRRVW